MSFAAFYAGLAGLQANDQRLEVVGNNLANLNTVGFKTSRVTFNDIFSGVHPSELGYPDHVEVLLHRVRHHPATELLLDRQVFPTDKVFQFAAHGRTPAVTSKQLSEAMC